MRKIEIKEEELLVVKQALSDLKEKLKLQDERYARYDLETIDHVLDRIRVELQKGN